MPDRGEGRFHRITGAGALPMLGGKVEERYAFFAVLLQAQRRLGILWLVGCDEQIKRLFSVGFGLGLPDIVQSSFGLWLGLLRQAIQHMHRFVLPASLLAALRIHLLQRRPKPYGTVHCPAVAACSDERGQWPVLARPFLGF